MVFRSSTLTPEAQAEKTAHRLRPRVQGVEGRGAKKLTTRLSTVSALAFHLAPFGFLDWLQRELHRKKGKHCWNGALKNVKPPLDYTEITWREANFLFVSNWSHGKKPSAPDPKAEEKESPVSHGCPLRMRHGLLSSAALLRKGFRAHGCLHPVRIKAAAPGSGQLTVCGVLC